VKVLVVTLVHITVGALWFGAMVYSLGVVQPRMSRLFREPTKAEDVYRELAAGNRWRVVAMIATIGGSGAMLAWLVRERADALWWTLVGAKVALLVAAAALFWWVSWRGWPMRIFALPGELPALQRRFRRVAVLMTLLVGGAFVLGVIATHR
jgi:hypothetical protein